MKKKLLVAGLSVLGVCLIVLVLVLCAYCGCFENYSAKNVIVASWQSTPNNAVSFDFGSYNLAMDYLYGPSDNYIAQNEKNFLQQLTDKYTPVVKDDVADDLTVYLFWENDNYYVMSAKSRDIQRTIFHFYAPVSVVSENGTKYYFPFFNGSGTDTGSESVERKLETDKDWSYFENFYARLGSEYCNMQANTKTILLKAVKETDTNKQLTDDYAIKLVFNSPQGTSATRNYFYWELLTNE